MDVAPLSVITEAALLSVSKQTMLITRLAVIYSHDWQLSRVSDEVQSELKSIIAHESS